MAKRKSAKRPRASASSGPNGPGLFATAGISSPVELLLLAAMERGGDSFETGRYLVTYRENAGEEGVKALKAQGLKIADARDFEGQAAAMESLDGADVLNLPEIGVAVVSGPAVQERGMMAAAQEDLSSQSAIASVDPEYFVFAENSEYLRGFVAATNAIARDLAIGLAPGMGAGPGEEDVQVLGNTWGLGACRVPPSALTGAGIKIAVLDTGMDLGHPDFAGRPFTTREFVGQPVQDLHSHGTHCIGTACGPRAPAGTTPRYGIAHASRIFVGKVLSNSGGSVGGSVLAGMNWAIANRCEVISMSLGGPGPVQPAYTNAGTSALRNGLLIIAAAGNSATSTGSPANSPTIMSVASLDQSLAPSSFSNFGKVDISGPGRDVFSSVPRPTRYGTKSGTSMATPHVAGCAALWAQSNPALRGMNLWRHLQATARRLNFPPTRVGAGLVQAP